MGGGPGGPQSRGSSAMTAYAVINDRGKEYKVREGDVIEIDRLSREVGASIEFDRVVLYSAGDEVEVGQPRLEGAKVTAEVLGETRGDKKVAVKFRRRKNSRSKKGHRQKFTAVRITGISKS
jgi:large subunit ribosomal protein L21